jgi:benzylsuccinate CoA-transferase BbsF subunit
METEDIKMTNELPLKGIKIAGFAWVGVGPHSMKFLATMGATIVRVESHKRVDALRLSGPYKDNIPRFDNSGWFAEVNASAYGISIDLTRPSGLEIAWKLIKWADIVTESFTPGTMKKLGLDYPSVSQVKPDIIYISTCQMGQTGPMAKFGGYGFHAAALAGITNVTGWPDQPPIPMATAFVDPISARFGAIAVLSALEYRRRTGRGQYIEISQWEAALQHVAPMILDYQVNGRSMSRNGNKLPYAAPHAVYPCQGDDRWCAIAVFNDKQWEGFCHVVDQEWTKEERFSTLLLRKKNEESLNALVSRWSLIHKAEWIQSQMQSQGVPSHVASTVKEVYEDPQMRYRDYLRPMKHSVMGENTYHGLAFKLSKAEGTWRAGPALGEHNEYVFKELLKMKEKEIAKALSEGGITTEADLPVRER